MPPFTRLTIPDFLLARVVEHARAELPNECCGLLAGSTVDGTGLATECILIGNDAASPTEFRTNARDLLAAFRDLRARGLELLAVYHSHPTSEPVPSRRDMEDNTYGITVVHLIVGLAGAEPAVRGWWIAENECLEAELVFSRPLG